MLILQDERLTIMESHVFLTTQVTAPAQRPPRLLRRELKLSREPGVPVLSSGGSLLAVSGGKLAYRHHRLTLHDAATGALRRKAR